MNPKAAHDVSASSAAARHSSLDDHRDQIDNHANALEGTGMTTATIAEKPKKSMLARTMSLAAGEMRMLLRNKTAITNVMIVPLLLLGTLAAVNGFDGANTGIGNAVLIAGVILAIGYVVYYNLVTTFVARRESYVLKRMRTGPTSDAGIIAAASVPSVVLAFLQVIVVLVALIVLGHAPGLVNVVPVIVAIVLGTLAFGGLALISTGFTRTAETAQITTLPVLMISLGLSGMFFPLHVLPDVLARIAHYTPGAAIVDLLNIGVAGTGVDGEQLAVSDTWTAMLQPAGILVAWTAIGAYYLGKSFRWEPRR